ncbi:hypothetical protein MGN70_011668 [Eutypa lata]|nr:hypothetical protein MGN70_011668 [Eutypa lata]
MTSPTTNFALVNNTGSSDAYAYVTGLDLGDNNAPVFIQSDGKTVYKPTSPSAPQSPLAADVAIPLGAAGSTTSVTIPHLAGGRIWFVVGGKLTFVLNPGPAIVEPSVTNQDDPNWGLHWGFAEFTYNDVQLFVNISYVDFVALPIALNLRNASGAEKKVEGIPAGGLDQVAQKLEAQHAADGAGWDKLVVRDGAGTLLRALSPNSGRVADAGLFEGYYGAYVDSVWAKYAGEDLTINTQWDWGNLKGRVVDGDVLSFGDQGTFAKPSAADIFSCSTGPFGGYPKDKADVLGNLGARLAAAFNRSTLLRNASQPDGEQVASYYQEAVTNHYARILHEVNADGRGYAFPYDDVVASGDDQPDQAGTVFDGAPDLLTVTLGSLQAASDGGDKKEKEGDDTTPGKEKDTTGLWKGFLGFVNKATGGCFGRS